MPAIAREREIRAAEVRREEELERVDAMRRLAPVATLNRVTKRYKATTALDGLELALRPGEVVALLGPNGAGKSTAVRLMLGLISASEGTVRVFGGDPRMPATRRRVGAMLQVARIPETLKVREHIDLFRSYYPRPLEFAEVVRIAKLEGIEDRRFGQLSGGQRQRVLFGLALCGDPDLIFLDEPTVGIDIESRRALWDEVRALARRGKTVLLTTHYLEEADALASRIVVINKGRVVSEGTPAEIKGQTLGRKIRCRTRLSLEELRGIPGVTHVTEDRDCVLVTATLVEDTVREMLGRDGDLSHLEIASPALEDAFLALTTSR
jgi:ABC-2 type transport system ATP-binding protein